jgi:hypothetical protein
MASLVYQLYVVEPEGGIDGVFYDLLEMKLPSQFADAIAVAGATISSERSNVRRMFRKGRVVTRAELRSLLGEAAVSDGWYFVGAPGRVGDPVEPVDVPELLRASAFVVDILDRRFLALRTVIPAVLEEAREVVVGAHEIEPCNLEQVRLLY